MADDAQRGAFDRRTVLKTAAGVGATALAGCTGSGERGGDFGGWFDGVSNYDGVADRTDADSVEVTVGAAGNDGYFAFAPAAVRVSTGTTVVWKWTGKGSMHNVAAEDGSFASEMLNAAGETFEHAFDEAGTYKYYCDPHRRAGMKGVVVVE